MAAEDSKHCGEADDPQIRDRALRLFTFLRELTELRTKTVRTCDQYDKVLWFSEIPQQPGCHCIAWRATEDEERAEIWVEVNKPRLKAPPPVPEALRPWLNVKEVGESSLEFPSLPERITVSTPVHGEGQTDIEPQTVFRTLDECPEIKALWEAYVEKQWWPWAEEDRKLQIVQDIYTDLFAIYQKQQRLGEAYEVVLGLGYLTWKTASGHEVKRHIITAQTALTFDPVHGFITLGPAGEGARPGLEQDMLEPQERPAPDQLNAIEHQVAEVGEALWDGLRIHAALKAWVHAASSRGQFDETLIPQAEVALDPKIHLAPALILRRRTERSLLRVFQEIIKQIRDGQPVPVGVKRLVTIIDDAAGFEKPEEIEERENDIRAAVEEIYFPLPANKEQLEIVQRLCSRQGILVQGPPGTGKSHTIANLVCHLLAAGQRVLVTSHTARALRVLRQKFPKEIADLCVVLLGDDLSAMQALEDSVRGITDRYNSWNAYWNRQQIATLESRLGEARRAEASTLTDLRALREAETYRHPPRFGTYQGTAQAIAICLKQEEPRYSWLSARPNEEQEPPLSDEEASELVRLLREIDKGREAELQKVMVDPDSLPRPSDFAQLIVSEKETYAAYVATADRRSDSRYEVLASTPRAKREPVAQGLLELLTKYEAVAHHIQPWARTAATQILAERDRAWRELLTTTREHLRAIGERHRRASQHRISGVEERDRSVVRAHAEALLRHLETGGRLGFGPFRPKLVKEGLYLIKEIRVDGLLCDRPQPLRNLLEWIEISDSLDALRKLWSPLTELPLSSFAAQVAEYLDLCEPLANALELHDLVGTLRKSISAIPGLREPTWHDRDDLRSLLFAIEAATVEEELAEARRPFDSLEEQLRSASLNADVHPAVGQLLEAVRSRDEQKYGQAHHMLGDLQKSRQELEFRGTLLQRLEVAAPALARDIMSSFADLLWKDRMDGFSAAWNWGRANGWLTRLYDPEEQQRLSNALEDHRRRIREITGQLAAEKAWGHCFRADRMTEHVRQHLMAWAQAMRRVGKGTGKYASMHRRAAREHMDECRSAIPAWIMPIYRVAETVHPGTDTFDVVVVDEASQSGPEALFLQYLAKKIVVVGDDKQISPDFVGITRQDVELLRQRHILDVPHSDALGVENSFFDQAQIRYGGRIRLREHFRCMPEIIQFSNQLCYRSDPLVPLRQFGAGRLTPVIVTNHVPDGYQKGHSPRVVNPPEAEALANQITKCCKDSSYDGKTMGVVSLLGEDQARLIERILLGEIGPEEMENRHLVCGDAYAFQGDERDVMFLSLVSAPTEGHRIGTLASPRDERRFNVAASRAKDQIWLFHTATLNDLSPKCLRYRLLEYCLNPQVQPTGWAELSIVEIESIARGTDRNRVVPPFPFDSWFEVDTFLRVVSRGYRVIPQFEIAGYHIDLLVEGMRGRLAVECDGDFWHGADRYDEDMARQRMLERCGWTFWRIRGSTFYRDPDAALEGLWTTLDRLGIRAAGQDADTQSSYENASRNELRVRSTPRNQVTGDIYRAGTARPAAETSKGESVRKDSRQARDDGSVKEPFWRPRSRADGSESERGILSDDELPDDLTVLGEAESTPSVQGQDSLGSNLHPAATPYRNWTSKPLPDPRAASIEDVSPGLVEIIASEGPMPCHRAYHVYAKAVGISRVGRQIRSVFNRAIRKAVRLGHIEERNEHGTRDQMNQIVRKKGTPEVLIRARGDRSFDEIPPSEIGALMNSMLQDTMIGGFRKVPDIEDELLFSSVLNHYSIKRMTQNIRAKLVQIKEQYVNPPANGQHPE